VAHRHVAVTAAVVLAIGGAVAGVLAAQGGGPDRAFRGSPPPAGIRLPAFALPDDSGGRVSSARLQGKVVLVTFLDTQCREACPLIAGHVGRALSLLPDDLRGDVVALAISTDPAEDTPEAVDEFLRRHRVRGRLRYLVAPESEMRAVWSAFAVLPSLDTGDDDTHSAPVRIYDRRGEWVSTQHAGADLTPENLAHDLRLAVESE